MGDQGKLSEWLEDRCHREHLSLRQAAAKLGLSMKRHPEGTNGGDAIMRKREVGQAFILVLILLAIGALLVVPALGLFITGLKSSQIVDQQTKSLYAVDAAQEWVLWRLTDPNFASDFIADVRNYYSIDVCGIPVNITIVMRAVEGTGGITLATEDKIKPTKTVDPDLVPGKDWYVYTYTINLDYLSDISDDNPRVGLEAIYDFLPAGINEYILGSTELRVDGGEWLTVPDPDDDELISNRYLKWPAEYDKDTHTGTFSANPAFYGIEDFEVSRQVKELRFEVRGRLDDQEVHCNWVILKMEDGTNTLSGPQAPITVGLDEPGECVSDSVMAVHKVGTPEIILPRVLQDVTYNIYITNRYMPTRDIEEITDYLAPGFEYVELLNSEIVVIDEAGMEHWVEDIEILELDPLAPDEPERSNPDNDISLLNINGVDRLQLRWRTPKFPFNSDITIKANETLKLTFLAQTTKEVSGSYYNEVVVIIKGAMPPVFSAAGVSIEEYAANYSWNTGGVMVPAYDSSAAANGTILDANLILVEGGVTISSWQIR